ncbi:MAG: hypothetical protein ACOYVG_12700 [Bacteroidota bacterium]
MMRKIMILGTGMLLMITGILYAQQKRISIEANYGLQRNFFVDDYNEAPNSFSDINFYKKSVVGKIGGFEIKYRIGKRASLGFGYAASSNTRIISYSGVVNGVNIGIVDFSIAHKNQFYQLGYEFGLGRRKSAFLFETGLFYVRPSQQEVEISTFNRRLLFDERNFNNSRLEEGGAFIGISFRKKIDTRFYLGVRSRFYYLISTNSPEALTLTPVLSYNF